MPNRPFEQKAQLRNDEQAGATPAIVEAKAYRALDPADPVTAWSGPISTFEGSAFEGGLGPTGTGRVAQVAQVRTDEQAGTPTQAVKKGYTNV